MTARILLADDHLVVRRGLRALLEARHEFVVCAEACEGREAIDLALKHKPDVAVVDVSLPVLNGIEELSSRPDLLDRGIVLQLPSLNERERKEERAIWEEFETVRPVW